MNNLYKHIFRSSRLQMFFKMSPLKNFGILRIKKGLQHRRNSFLFEKAKRRAEKVNRTSVYAEGDILHNSQINHLCRNVFFDRIKLCRTATSSKTRPQRRGFLVKFTKYVGNSFLQNTTGRLLLVIAVSLVVKGELAN